MSNDTDVSAPRDFIPRVSVEDLEKAIAERRLDDGSRELLDAEQGYINAWRKRTGRKENASENLTGLALSGGGIRSATFALGVMQALAKRDLLKKFDYLSTVSGGGYIGSSLTWLLGLNGGAGFGLGKNNFPYGTVDPTASGGRAENRILKYLREHGNYLTPGDGVTLASGIAVALRGILLNLLVWIPVTIGVMLCFLWVSALASSSKLSDVVTGGVHKALQTVLPEKLVLPPGSVQSFFTIERSPFLFDFALWLAVTLGGLFVLASVYYSLRTFWARRQSTRRYWLRRQVFERWAGRVIWAAGILLIVGTLPHVANLLEGEVAKAGGPGAFILAGIAGGLRLYFKTQSKDGGGIPINIFAPVVSILLVYGIVLLAYQIAVWTWEPRADWLPYLISGLIVVGVVTGIVVNVNYISLHRFYRDRLMEAFMPDLDTALADPGTARRRRKGMAIGADRARLHGLQDIGDPRSPYHVVNTNLVLVDAKDRRRRIRGGDNFILSPLYCGSNATGWRETEKFMRGRMTLATAMAISGAAANPNAGVGGKGLTRNSLVSLVMALLNVRLGYWVTNPKWKRPYIKVLPIMETLKWWPPNHFFPGASCEIGGFLGGGYHENNQYVQISDGGHFENLALYELIRRRIRLIVCLDGGADKDFTFSDLEVALRRMAADFGARIVFDESSADSPGVSADRSDDKCDKGLSMLIPRRPAFYPMNARVAKQGHIVGKIIYADETEGTLIFLKTTFIDGLSVETRAYKGANRDFPDQTTADQFFDEEQFEAYRELGYTIAKKMIDDIEKNSDYDNKAGLREFIPKKQSRPIHGRQ